MEELNNYSFREYKYIVWFLRLLLLLLVTIIVLLFVLNINEAVSINDGEIVAVNPQSDYKAPFEAQLLKVYTREGQDVHKGDTLLVIRNDEYSTRYAAVKAQVTYLQNKIQSI